MAHEKKPTNDDIEKLRKILDNPGDPLTIKCISPMDRTLDSLRKQLTYDRTVPMPRRPYTTTRMSLKLEPTVTIRQRVKPVVSLPTPRSASLPEFEPVPVQPMVEQPITPEEPFNAAADLIEIEKVDVTYPEFVEVAAEQEPSPAEESTRLKGPMQTETPEVMDQNLPEWQPVNETQETELPVTESSMKSEEPAEPPLFEPVAPEAAPEEVEEKPIELTPQAKDQPKALEEPTSEPPEFQRLEPESVQLQPPEPESETPFFEPTAPSQKAIQREQKKLEKQKEKEERHQRRIEERKRKAEARQKENAEKQLLEESQEFEPILEEPAPQEPTPQAPAEPKTIVDLSAFKGIQSIDEQTGELLYKNGYFSIDNLRDATVDELVQIRGIKRKLAKRIKNEIEEQPKEKPTEEPEGQPTRKPVEKKVEDEFIPIKKKVGAIKQKKKQEDVAEWETFAVEKPKRARPVGATYEGYTLYKKVSGNGANRTTTHFFSKEKPSRGSPAAVPKGYEIAVNAKTKIPYLKKKR